MLCGHILILEIQMECDRICNRKATTMVSLHSDPVPPPLYSLVLMRSARHIVANLRPTCATSPT